MASWGRLWQLVRGLSPSRRAPPLFFDASPSSSSSAADSAAPFLDAWTPSTTLFDWLREHVWGPRPATLQAEYMAQVQSVLQLLLVRADRRAWPPQEMQVLLSLLRLSINAAATHDTTHLVTECLEILVRWGSPRVEVPSALKGEVVQAAALLGCEAAVQELCSINHRGDKDKAPRAAELIRQALHLWVLAGRLHSCPMSKVVSEVARLLSYPSATTCLLDFGGLAVWQGVLKALLLELTEKDASVLSSTDVEYRLVRVCLHAVSGTSRMWAWDAWADTLMQLPEDEEEVVDGVLWPADSVGWRRESATYAILDAMDAPGSWQERATASVGAVALISGDFDDERLWKKFLGLIKDVMQQSTAAHRKAGAMNPEDMEGLRTARVGLCRALVMLGNSRFCARSFEGESRAWTREWGLCLTALLRLSLEDVVVAAGAANSAGGGEKGSTSTSTSKSSRSSSTSSGSNRPDLQHPPQQQADVLAATLCQRCLSPAGNRQQEMAKAITALFKASDAVGQTEAFSILRAYARTLVAAGGTDSWGLVLLLQVCLVLGDPASAAIASTEQVVWVLEVLDALAALVMVGPASPPSLLQGALLQASGNLQAVLEDDVEEGWLKEARDWIMKALGRQKERSEQRAKEMAALKLDSSTTITTGITPVSTSLQGGQNQQQQKQHQNQQQQQRERQEENRLAFLIHLAFAMCIQTRRPAPHQYVAELTRFLLQEVLCPYFPRGDVAQAQVHRCLRSLISNPNLLAYRAGRMEHWDEARRRVMAAYVRVALEAYPRSTAFQDLAYCVGAAIGATPTEADPAGQALLLHCLHLIQDRAIALLRQGTPGEKGVLENGVDPGPAQLRRPATRDLVKLLFQTLLVCPLTVLEGALQSLGQNFVLQGFGGRPESRVAVLRLLKGVVFGEVETMRQSVLAKWYLTLLREEEGLQRKEGSVSEGKGRSRTGAMAMISRL